jgi:hypothetical protein
MDAVKNPISQSRYCSVLKLAVKLTLEENLSFFYAK